MKKQETKAPAFVSPGPSGCPASLSAAPPSWARKAPPGATTALLPFPAFRPTGRPGPLLLSGTNALRPIRLDEALTPTPAR
ncbi:MAG: hypothetical protein HSCHL_0504 [Hydrogenibacillus schlegelii]|uniref:Uncharacterized protein n=1 Tax=Hydrogenibacillus schlegelii TaxID=1484 RepID=A0A2T5GDJ0_HYDSH|nr:MAG: hypothetical protein HSCHL_0504 [Hydrogenibacillus schlegelii]